MESDRARTQAIVIGISVTLGVLFLAFAVAVAVALSKKSSLRKEQAFRTKARADAALGVQTREDLDAQLQAQEKRLKDLIAAKAQRQAVQQPQYAVQEYPAPVQYVTTSPAVVYTSGPFMVPAEQVTVAANDPYFSQV